MARQRNRFIKIALLSLALGLTILLFSQRKNLDVTLDLRQAVGTTHHMETAQKALEQTNQPALPTRNLSVRDVSATTTLGPRFTGRDDQNRHWQISAAAAHHTGMEDSSGTVFLDHVDATAVTSANTKLHFEALQGQYNRANNQLKLKEKVLISGQGITLEAEEVESDLDTRKAWSNKPVKITANQGELVAESMEILHNGEHIRLEGGVRGTLHLKEKETQKNETK